VKSPDETVRQSVTVVAEIGVNHNGNLTQAKRLVEAAINAGADVVKTQFFDARTLVDSATPTARYQRLSTVTETMRGLLNDLELSLDDIFALAELCKAGNVGFAISVFSEKDINRIAPLKPDFIKIASGEITNVPLLIEAGRSGLPLVLSTGMSYEYEVLSAVNHLIDVGASSTGITLLHCTSAYPAPLDQLDLQVIGRWRTDYPYKVGYSDHSLFPEVAVAAVALGATLIEKHLTLDRYQQGPDHASSLVPDQFSDMIRMIRHIEQSLGSSSKVPHHSETENRMLARKSIFAKSRIVPGETFGPLNIMTRRPQVGLGAEYWKEIMGLRAKRGYEVGQSIDRAELDA